MSDLFLRSLLAENLALTWFLGLCTFLAGRPDFRAAFGIGICITLVLAITMPLNRLVSGLLLSPGAWQGFPDLDLAYVRVFAFLLVLAATLQVLDLMLARLVPGLNRAIGRHLPLIPIQSVLLAGSLFMAEQHLDPAESLVGGLGYGLGWLIAILAFTAIRERMRYHDMPDGLEGAASGFILAGLLSMGFLAMSKAVLP